MSLRVWLPLNGNLDNIGLSNVTVTNNGATVDNNGKIGKCYSFNNGLGINTDFEWRPTNKWSLALWVNGSSKTGCCIRNSTKYSPIIDFGGGNNVLRLFYWYDATSTYMLTSTISDAGWHHLVGTSDGHTMKLYIDGVLISSLDVSAHPNPYSTGYTYIGYNSVSGGFIGKMNDVRIYDHCLSPKEVKEISKGLCLHYKLGGVGGENLLSGTRGYANPWVLTSASIDGNNHVADGTGIIEVTPGATYTISCETDGTWTNTHSGSGHKPADKDCSLWIYLRIQGTTKPVGNYDSPLFLGRSYSFTCSKDGYKGKAIWKWTAPSNAYTIQIRYNTYSDGTTPMTVKMWNMKVELGSVATPWCPNPADTLYTQLGYANNVEYDLSGYRNNGTKVGTIKWSNDTPRYSGSYEFSSNRYINVGQANGKMPTDAVTAACWARLDNWDISTGMRIISCTEGGGWQLSLNGTDGNLCCPLYVAGVGYSQANYARNKISAGWHHCAMTFDGLNHILYLDGKEVAKTTRTTKAAIGYNGTAPLLVSGEPNGSAYTGYSWLGRLSDLRIYATALSATDIKELYETSAIATNNGNLMAYELIEE